MSSVICERVATYNLSDEERAALSAVLHRIDDRKKDRRKPEVNVEETIRHALLMAAICRGSGTAHLDHMYTHVVQQLTTYRKEYRC
ncbi:MAG: hypothetical protein WC455_27950 [Dehalococcoidia bacterium]|jgi:hypothetical protein